MQSVTTEQQGDIRVVTVNNPPVNALSWHVRDGIGVAMENGSEKTKRAAGHITADNNHDGIALFLEHYAF